MSVAVFMQQWNAGTWNMLPALGFLWASLYWMVLGSGRLGLDYYLPSIYRLIIRKRWGKPVLWLTAILCLGFLLIHGGVQKTRKQSLIINAVSNDDVRDVVMSLRGSDKPLSWNVDYTMQPLVRDSLFAAKIEIYTGYPYTELKLVQNGVFELQGQENRTIFFEQDGTTEVNLIFNQPIQNQ